MVGLPRSRQSHDFQRSLPELLLILCKSLQSEYSVQFDVHFQSGLELFDYSPEAAGLLKTALEQAAMVAMPDTTIDIAIHTTRRGTEIEVVASTSDIRTESLRAFCREKAIVGRGQTVSLYRARCPDGSLAWIIVQANAARLRRPAS